MICIFDVNPCFNSCEWKGENRSTENIEVLLGVIFDRPNIKKRLFKKMDVLASVKVDGILRMDKTEQVTFPIPVFILELLHFGFF